MKLKEDNDKPETEILEILKEIYPECKDVTISSIRSITSTIKKPKKYRPWTEAQKKEIQIIYDRVKSCPKAIDEYNDLHGTSYNRDHVRFLLNSKRKSSATASNVDDDNIRSNPELQKKLIANLKDLFDVTNKRNADLEKDNSNIKTECERIKKRAADLERENINIKAECDQIAEEAINLTKENLEAVNKCNRFERRVAELEKQNVNMREELVQASLLVKISNATSNSLREAYLGNYFILLIRNKKVKTYFIQRSFSK